MDTNLITAGNRGLQGTYNAFCDRHGITIPYGSVLVFSLCCGQIMYAWTMRPDTIPLSYAAWITQASKVGEGAVRINRQLAREGVADQDVKEEIMRFIHDMVCALRLSASYTLLIRFAADDHGVEYRKVEG